MTRDELIRNLKYTMKKHENDVVDTFGTNISLMCKDVLDYLEQEPSEDCISRDAVLDIIQFEDKWLFDCKSNNADTDIAFDAMKSKVSKLPSVNPIKPKGEWIPIKTPRNTVVAYKCNVCEMSPYKGHTSDFCPNCGADMGGNE